MAPGTTGAQEPIVAALDVRTDSIVSFTLRVTNPDKGKHELRFPSGHTHEIVVIDEAGHVIWRSSQGQFYTQGMRTKLLPSQKSVSFHARWNSAGRSGRFRAVATLKSSTDPLQEQAAFTLR